MKIRTKCGKYRFSLSLSKECHTIDRIHASEELKCSCHVNKCTAHILIMNVKRSTSMDTYFFQVVSNYFTTSNGLVSESPLWHTSKPRRVYSKKTKQNENFSTIYKCAWLQQNAQAHADDDFSIIVPLLNFLLLLLFIETPPLLLQSIRCTQSVSKQKKTEQMLQKSLFEIVLESYLLDLYLIESGSSRTVQMAMMTLTKRYSLQTV